MPPRSTRGLRADRFLVDRGYAATRAQAQSAISAGRVEANGAPVRKPSQLLASDATIGFEKPHPYVSRAALKLIAALDRFALSPAGRICLDAGASTGGFTQVLLERGAARVYAVDVGRAQLHPTLGADPRIVSLGGVNARHLSRIHVPESADAVVADLSFISLKLVLPAALHLAGRGAWLVALVKPQFEAGRAAIGKGGIVRDDRARLAAVAGIADWLPSLGWQVEGTIESPLPGKSGNREYLLAARRA